MPVVHTALTAEPLDRDRLEALVATTSVGATVTFVGLVRNHDDEATGEVIRLDYTCHPDADRLLAQVAAATVAEHDRIGEVAVAVEHRVGSLSVGEAAIVVVAAAAHRGQAFAVCESLVDRIKAEVPIWKHQFEASGRVTWSNLGLPQ